jgi:hypothetical protein
MDAQRTSQIIPRLFQQYPFLMWFMNIASGGASVYILASSSTEVFSDSVYSLTLHLNNLEQSIVSVSYCFQRCRFLYINKLVFVLESEHQNSFIAD